MLVLLGVFCKLAPTLGNLTIGFSGAWVLRGFRQGFGHFTQELSPLPLVCERGKRKRLLKL
jgi:hypothetical protein